MRSSLRGLACVLTPTECETPSLDFFFIIRYLFIYHHSFLSRQILILVSSNIVTEVVLVTDLDRLQEHQALSRLEKEIHPVKQLLC